MTRKLFFVATALFWLSVLGIWAGSRWWAAPQEEVPAVPARHFALTEVARHAGAEDCWMAIDGKVYDLTAYLPDHPSRPGIILPWCGKEATEAYRTKTKGRPHSPLAAQLLATYQIGLLENGQ